MPSLPRPSRVASPRLLGVRARLSASEPTTGGEGLGRRCRDRQKCSKRPSPAGRHVQIRDGKHDRLFRGNRSSRVSWAAAGPIHVSCMTSQPHCLLSQAAICHPIHKNDHVGDLPAVTTCTAGTCPSLYTIPLVECNCHNRSLQDLLNMKASTPCCACPGQWGLMPAAARMHAASISPNWPGQAGQAPPEAQWQPQWHVGFTV